MVGRSKAVYGQMMERIVYDHMGRCWDDNFVMNIHLRSYAFAHLYVNQKVVLDAACGTCFGSMIFSTGAKKIIAVDKSKEAIAYGKKLKFFCPITYLVKDLDKDILPEADVCVSIETIEHLNGDGFFLKNLKVEFLIFAMPIGMYNPGGFHKMLFEKPEEATKYLVDNGWKPGLTIVEDMNLWNHNPVTNIATGIRSLNLLGVAERKEKRCYERARNLPKRSTTGCWMPG